MSGMALVFQHRAFLSFLEKKPYRFKGRFSTYGFHQKFVCFMDVTRGDGKYLDHVWMPNDNGLEKWSFKPLDQVEFDAAPYEYETDAGKKCYGLRCTGNVNLDLK